MTGYILPKILPHIYIFNKVTYDLTKKLLYSEFFKEITPSVRLVL